MKTLRPYQLTAVDLSDAAFDGGTDRVLIIMATGLGKTVISAEKARRFFTKNPTANAVFMAHRRDILRQARLEFIEMCGDLVSTGIISSEDMENPDAQMLFITFQTMEGRRERYKPDHFSLMIIDEAHHGYADTYLATIKYFVPRRLFGMTATEERADGLDIRDIFGEPVFEYPLAKGIADGWLAEVDYRMLTDNIDITKLRQYIKSVAGGDRKVTRKHLDTNIFLEERMDRQVDIIREEQQRGESTVIFCRNIEDLKAFHLRMPEAVPYYGEMRPEDRVRTLNGYREGTIKTLLVIDMLNEGIDVPDIEVVVFRRGTDSLLLWFQQLGRGTRLTPRKRRLTALDFVANCDRVMAVHELGLEITKWGGGTGMQWGLHLPGPGLGIHFSAEIIDLIGLLQRLQVDLYPTYEEASVAAQALGIRWCTEYLGHKQYKNTPAYKKDPRLPSNPNATYAGKGWRSWEHFLGTLPYETYEEASVAVRILGIHSVPEYRGQGTYKGQPAAYKKDPRLTSSPSRKYAGKGWRSWEHFLDTLPYETYEEASLAAKRLGIETAVQYNGSKSQPPAYKEDPRLPGGPSVTYRGKGWSGWAHFLGTEHLPGRKKTRKKK